MLPKDLILTHTLKNGIYPKQLKSDETIRSTLIKVLDILEYPENRKFDFLEKAVRDELDGVFPPKISQGISKIVLDYADFDQGNKDAAETFRESLFDKTAVFWSSAESENCKSVKDMREFYRKMDMSSYSGNEETLESAVYPDLKKNRSLKAFVRVDPEKILAGYNSGQIIGLLAKARTIKVSLSKIDNLILRDLLNKLNYKGLIFNLIKSKSETLLEIEGPESIWEKSAIYSRDMAEIFPAIASLEQVKKVEADIIDGKGTKKFTWKNTGEFIGTKAEKGVWMKTEILDFIDKWKNKYPEINIRRSEEFFTNFKGNCRIPDITLGKGLNLEIMRYRPKDMEKKFSEAYEFLPSQYSVVFKGDQALAEKLKNKTGIVFIPYKSVISPSRIHSALKEVFPEELNSNPDLSLDE